MIFFVKCEEFQRHLIFLKSSKIEVFFQKSSHVFSVYLLSLLFSICQLTMFNDWVLVKFELSFLEGLGEL